jgi:hypothetical protein
MLKKIFQANELTDLSVLTTDAAVTGNALPGEAITRNPHRVAISEDPNEIYNRARQIYFRAKRVRHSRSVSIF